MSDLAAAYAALKGKQNDYATLWRYYDGDHPLVYSHNRLREVFKGLEATFSENWCAVVVDSVVERLRLEAFTVGQDEEATQALGAMWTRTEMDLDADDAHLAALVCGEAFVIVWQNEEGVEAYYNDPRLCHVQYDPESPRNKLWAAKWWRRQDGRYRMNIYYADHIEYFVTEDEVEAGTIPGDARNFVATEEPTAPNPFGQIPVFHLRRERRKVVSELVNVLPIQASVNKLLADMMIAAEFGAFKQRWIITNADVSDLRNIPNEIWEIPAGDGMGEGTKVGQFDASDLGNYIKGIDRQVNAIAAISRTPKHFFFDQSGAPSGEALIAMEAPLNKKVERYISLFSRTWQRVASFMLSLAGFAVMPEDVTATFAAPETVQRRTEAEIREIRVRAGEPLTYVMRTQGATEADLVQMQQDKEAEQASAQNSLAMALLEQQRRFDQDADRQGAPGEED